jgi:CrcB protein
MSPELKLFFVTGFLGALTTFSTLSAEVVALIRACAIRLGRWRLRARHLFGSLLMTGAGHFDHRQVLAQ